MCLPSLALDSSAAVDRLDRGADGVGFGLNALVVADVTAGKLHQAPALELFHVLHFVAPEADVVLGVMRVAEDDGVYGGDRGRLAVAHGEGLDRAVLGHADAVFDAVEEGGGIPVQKGCADVRRHRVGALFPGGIAGGDEGVGKAGRGNLVAGLDGGGRVKEGLGLGGRRGQGREEKREEGAGTHGPKGAKVRAGVQPEPSSVTQR